MFGRKHKIENIKLKEEIADLQDVLDDLYQIVQSQGELNLLEHIQRLSSIDTDMFVNGINKDAKKVNVHAFMRSGDTMENLISIQYGIDVSMVKEDGLVQSICQFTISEMGDGGSISEFALRRRQNTVFLTKTIADYIKLEIERGYIPASNKVEVTRTEEWIDKLLLVSAQPSIGVRKE